MFTQFSIIISIINSLFLGNAIALGENDVERLMRIREQELSEKRLEKCDESKLDISTVVESESDEVDGWLVTCKVDKDRISKFS